MGRRKRAEDLAPLLAKKGEAELGIRQGTILDWDQATGANTVGVGGSQLTNLPVLSTNGSVILYPGDNVVLLRYRTQYFILGRVTTTDHQRRNVIVPGTMGPTGDSWTTKAPRTTSSSYTQLWTGYLVRGTRNCSFVFQTNVDASTTGLFSFRLNGIEVVNSGTYSTGAGQFAGDAVFPDSIAYNDGCTAELWGRVASGTGGVTAVFMGLYGT